MLFRILGPVAVDGPDGEVSLGGPRHRVLLATLLTAPGRVVPAERLIEAMWGDEPPRRAVEILHVRVSELRKLLREGSEAELILTRRPGYLLDVTPDDIDAHRFADAAAAGRRALADGDAEGASARLSAALADWRGSVLVELAERPFAQVEIARWEHLRRQALADRIDADLLAGRHREVLAELEALVTADPLHERHRGQLMLALYRDGRQGAALAVYDDAARVLREELGIDPGTELANLHLAVLRQDPELLGPAHRGAELPAPLTSFVGRRDELGRVAKDLAQTRLVTLTGVGGSGKSRLAVEAARSCRAKFPDGLHVVELAAVAEAGLIAATVAARIGVQERPRQALREAIAAHLGQSTVLLVLDSCEHLLDGVAELAAYLLAACPALRVLCTSRERLGITGEVVHPVPGLPVPAADADFGHIASADAVRLFTDRAVAVQAAFRLTVDNAGSVAEIVGRLDGLPLAIELAAARTTVFSPGQIVARLEDRFRLLSHGSREALPRHQTLRAVLDWSFGLLTRAEQRLFARLGVFAGGFTLGAAEAVCSDGLEVDVVELLARLVDKSLVTVDATGWSYRYGQLETLRTYALDVLSGCGDAESIRTGHAAFYRGLAREAAVALRTDRLPAWLDRLETEDGNLRAAMDWALTSGDHETAAVIAGSAYKLWELHARYQEGRTWLGRALADDRSMPDAVRGWGLFADAVLAVLAGDYQGGEAACTAAIELGRACGDPTVTSRALGLAGVGALVAEDLSQARELMTEAERVAEDAPWARAWAVYFRSTVALAEARWELAVDLAEGAEALLGPRGDVELRAWIDLSHGHALQRLGHERPAVRLVAQAVTTFGALQVTRGVCFALIPCSFVLASHRRAKAIRLLAAAEVHRVATGTFTAPFIAAWVDEATAMLRASLTPEEFAAERERGQAMALDEAVEAALAELAACLDEDE